MALSHLAATMNNSLTAFLNIIRVISAAAKPAFIQPKLVIDQFGHYITETSRNFITCCHFALTICSYLLLNYCNSYKSSSHGNLKRSQHSYQMMGIWWSSYSDCAILIQLRLNLIYDNNWPCKEHNFFKPLLVTYIIIPDIIC